MTRIGYGIVIMGIALSPLFPEAEAGRNRRSLEAVVRPQVDQALPPNLGVISVSLSGPRRRVRASAVSIRWNRAPRSGRITLPVVVRTRRGERRRWARIELGDKVPVLVARRRLRAGSRVGATDLVSASRAVRRGKGWRIPAQTLAGAKVLRDVPANTIVDDSHVQRPPPVARGTKVIVFVKRGRLQVSRRGTLQYAVRPGESAAVRLKGVNRIVRGRLVDHRTVLLEGSK